MYTCTPGPCQLPQAIRNCTRTVHRQG